MSDKQKRKAAENAMCDLNMAHAVMALCENSLFRTEAGQKFGNKVARMCMEHGALQLRAYDRHSS